MADAAKKQKLKEKLLLAKDANALTKEDQEQSDAEWDYYKQSPGYQSEQTNNLLRKKDFKPKNTVAVSTDKGMLTEEQLDMNSKRIPKAEKEPMSMSFRSRIIGRLRKRPK